MKVHVTISLDEAYVVEAKKRDFNLSGVLNDCLGDLLGGKKSKPKEEDRLAMIIEISEEIKLPNDEVLKIADTLDRGTVGLWRHFKHQFEPNYNMWDFMKIRQRVRELLNVKAGGKT